MYTHIKNVCVYCGSQFGTRDAYKVAAELLGQRLAESGIRLVYGGGGVGLMGVVAQSVMDHGGQVTGIIPNFLDQAEIAKNDITTVIRTETMHDRKAKMAEISDGFVVLPGGLGTLDETFEILTWRQLQLHSKPVVLVNTEGYWDHFVHLIEHQVREGFVRERHLALFRIVDSVDGVIPALLAEGPGDEATERLDRA